MIILHPRYKPLKSLTTRYAVVTGGRASGKSTAIAHCLLDKSNEYKGKTILFTRYTLTNADTSIIPEFLTAIEEREEVGRYSKVGNSILNVASGTTILFKGIKTSTGINTAALKSIPKLAIWVNDESEELVDEATFDTIDLSIRDSDEHCEVWLVLNPPDKTHFIYRRFFANNNVPQVIDTPEGLIKGDITYIHTTYLNNKAHLPQDYIDKAERCKESDYRKYRNIWLGEWDENAAGLVFPDWEEARDEDWPSGLPIWYGLDWGFSPDPTAVVRIAYDPIHATVWWKEVECINESIPSDVGPVIAKDAAQFGLTPGQCLVYCDSANPAAISELRRICSINAVKADKRDREYQVSWMHGFRFRYIGEGIRKEVQSYSYEPSKTDRSVFTRKPQDGNDHLIDGGRYGTYTHLQRLGVAAPNE